MARTHYGNILLCCLVASAGLCCAIFPYMMPTSRFVSVARLELSFIVTRCLLIALMYYVQVQCVIYILKRGHFHRDQKVFWPLQCRHCARTLGLLSAHKGLQIQCTDDRSNKTTVTLDETARASENKDGGSTLRLRIPDNASTSLSRYEDQTEPSRWSRNVLKPSSSLPDLRSLDEKLASMDILHRGIVPAANPVMVSSTLNNDCHHELFTQPDRSLLVVFNLLGFISILNIPLQMLESIKCLEDAELSCMTKISKIVILLLHVSFITLVICALIFFNTYHEAAFRDETSPNRLFGIAFAFCFWVSAIKIVVPISESLNPFDEPCVLSGWLGKFLHNHNKILSRINAECGVIAGGIIWELWKSIIPHRFLKMDEGKASFVPFIEGQSSPSWTIWNSWTRYLQAVKRKIGKGYMQSTDDPEGRNLIESRKRHSSLPLVLMLIASFILGVILMVVAFFLPDVTEQSTVYVVWCFKLACVTPLIGLIFYQSFLTKASRILAGEGHNPHRSDSLEGHEFILIVSCSTSFLLSLFRIGCCIATMTFSSSLTHDELVLASYAIVYGVNVIFHLWVTTSFLLVVQRQVLHRPVEVKWTKICLIYVILVNGMIWFVGVIGIHNTEGHEFRIYYGHSMGKFLKEVFDPLVYLFPLHAAILAYETYKTIKERSSFNDERGDN